jgi:hypothetical protein
MRRRAGETPVSFHGRRGRRAFFTGAVFAVALPASVASGERRSGAEARSAPAGAPFVTAQASCEPMGAPGKLRCAVRARPEQGAWQWGDVVVLAAPPFALPLRTRLGLFDVVHKDESGMEFALALGATAAGAGTLRVRVRAVVCGERGCLPVTAEAEAQVEVGPSAKTPRI